MLILLVPEPAIYIAALEQLIMPAAIVDPAALEDEYGVGIHQYREPVRNDDNSTAFGNP